MQNWPKLHGLIVSAPFGNYIQPHGCTATLGTFTAGRRPGRLWRVLKTVRYYPGLEAWVNKIGLRNPGMPWLARKVRDGKIDVADKIVSIHGFTDSDWYTLLDQAALLRPLAVELNMSCPNIGKIEWPQDLFKRAVATEMPVIVKIPPVNYQVIFHQAAEAGVGTFHCCNTLPIPAGGMSGKPLKPFSIQCIWDIRQNLGGSVRDELLIIGGGGITTPQDIDDYAAVGARRFAIGTKVFNPVYLFTHAPLEPLIERAEVRATRATGLWTS